MSATAIAEPVAAAEALHRGKVGLICLFISESHIFGALIVAYLLYLPQSKLSDTPPGKVLQLPLTIVATLCLLSSSVTVHWAAGSLRRGARPLFRLWWLTTIGFGLLFLAGTAIEWTGLIREPPNGHGLTLGRNLFGTTYFTLVGFHAFHVTLGVIALAIVFWLVERGEVSADRPAGAELISWYWHFVDGVWVVVFSVVYLYSQ